MRWELLFFRLLLGKKNLLLPSVLPGRVNIFQLEGFKCLKGHVAVPPRQNLSLRVSLPSQPLGAQ